MSNERFNLFSFHGKMKILHMSWIVFFATFVVWFNHAPLLQAIGHSLSLSSQELKTLLTLNVAMAIPAHLSLRDSAESHPPILEALRRRDAAAAVRQSHSTHPSPVEHERINPFAVNGLDECTSITPVLRRRMHGHSRSDTRRSSVYRWFTRRCSTGYRYTSSSVETGTSRC